MNYIVCEEPRKFLLKTKERPNCGENEALLKIKQVGICGTDLHAYGGNQAFFTYPRILGHELAAEITELNSLREDIKVGDKVILMPYISCGKCYACRLGKTNCCSNISVLGVHSDGGMQEYYTVPDNILINANGMSDYEIALVEPLAIGAHAIRRAKVSKGEFVLVIGCGPIGLGMIKLAQIDAANVIAMDFNEQRLTFAKEKLGIEHIVNAKNAPFEQIKHITDNDFCSVVFDATGNRKALESGINYMSHGGRYVLVGLSKGELTFSHPRIHAKESTIMCSRNATYEDFERVKSTLQSGQFPTEDFITHKVKYTEMIKNFDSWLKPETGVIKAMVAF